MITRVRDVRQFGEAYTLSAKGRGNWTRRASPTKVKDECLVEAFSPFLRRFTITSYQRRISKLWIAKRVAFKDDAYNQLNKKHHL